MASASVTLGGITFRGHEVPEKISFGGKQKLAKHVLIGGRRVTDAMGPDECDIRWEGRFRGADALSRALAVDAMRKRGAQIPLTWGGLFYLVVIEEFEADYHRSFDLPYRIRCYVIDDGSGSGGDAGPSLDALVGGDLGGAVGLIGATLSGPVGAALGALQAAVGSVTSLASTPISQATPIQTAAALAVDVVDEAIVGADASMGVDSVADLRDLDPRPVRKAMTVVGERIIHELRGLSCLSLELMPAQRKGCAVTRSFSSRVTDRDVIEQAVAVHVTRLGEKLRRSGLGTTHVSVLYHTSTHDHGTPMRSVSTTVTLPEATNDTLALIAAARLGVARTWREQGERPWRYSKAGIITTDLVPLQASQRALIGALAREHSGPLMAAMDACNARFGSGSVVPARAGLQEKRAWSTKFEMRSPRYTTQVNELPTACARFRI